jgi:hypothetical protein
MSTLLATPTITTKELSYSYLIFRAAHGAAPFSAANRRARGHFNFKQSLRCGAAAGAAATILKYNYLLRLAMTEGGDSTFINGTVFALLLLKAHD